MGETRYRIKSNARVILKGNWMKAIVIILIIYFLDVAISSLDSAFQTTFRFPALPTGAGANVTALAQYARTTMVVTLIFCIILFIFTTPLMLGQTEWYWNLTSRKPNGVEGIFAWFGSIRLFLKSIWLYVNIILRLLLWGALLIVAPVMICHISAGYFYPMQQSDFIKLTLSQLISLLVFILAGIWLIGGALLFLYIASRYFLAPFLLVEDNTRKVTACVRASIRYTKKKRGEIFIFYLSFLGWGLLCLLVLPALYVVPYFQSSCAIYAKYMIYSERLKEKDDKDHTLEFDKSVY